MSRLSTGVPGLDAKLGGGLIPGTMTVVVGSSGIGKTQFGIQFARAALAREKATGVIFDMAARIDPQGHFEYAKRIADWTIKQEESEQTIDYAAIFDKKRPLGDYLQALTTKGRRVTRRDVDFDTWNDWHADLAKHLDTTIAFFYSHFIRGCKRVVIDGIEPVTHQGESIQFELLEYVYHQILRKEPAWLARDLFRQFYLANEKNVAKNEYDLNKIGCVVLYTSPETSLDAMVEKPLDEGDLLAGANTIIYLGKVREGTKFRRAMYVSKHRGSNCSDEIMLYEIDEKGLRIL
ncbi:MAG: recombinase RecA [Planctomycetaceae bacterium]|jgi:KaiC/GvpD/RAD55 family RecA-like ATPase|nr:recombinase RecA [Planctomycetaceae bacterium]